MKRWICFALVLLLSFLPLIARAQDGYIADTAVIDGGQIFYSGSVDGTEIGIFVMNLDGSEVHKIFDDDLPPLAGTSGYLLLFDWETDGALLIDEQGNLIKSFPDAIGGAIGWEGRFYTVMSVFDRDGANEEALMAVDGEQRRFLYPLTIDGGKLYFLDNREYGEQVAEYNDSDSLAYIDLSDKSVHLISGPGTRFLGLDDTYLYYTRSSFDLYADDAYSENSVVEVDEGLFRAEKDGQNEIWLADAGALEGDIDQYFSFVHEGIIYGHRVDFSQEDFVVEIVRVNKDGEELPSIEVVGDYILQAVRGDELLCVHVELGEDEAGEYWQRDQIVLVNLTDESERILNPDGNLQLQFAEGDPELVVVGDMIFFLAYDLNDAAVGLYMCRWDRPGVTRLALGVVFAGEDEGF